MSNESLLSEGFDFIEESTPFSTEPLSFQECDEIIISESNSSKVAHRILGRVSGVFAPVAGMSRNNRRYSETHWQTQLLHEELQNRLKSHSMFGMLGHDQSRVTDADLRAGNISHVVTKMEIREDANGVPFLFGEFEILDTPAGRILEAMYAGGANLYVSSRAAGKLLDVPGESWKMVDENSFYVHCWDVVINPGFLQAHPTFEAVNQSPEIKNTIQESVEVEEEPKKETANEDLDTLKSQIAKLTKIVEKVVDDVYETTEETPAPTKSLNKDALMDFVKVMSESNVSEETFNSILDMIIGEVK